MLKMTRERSEISSRHSGLVVPSSLGIRHWSFAALVIAIMFSSANLKAASVEDSSVIAFPPSSAQKWVLPNGLTIIVQEDRSAPVASVQAWCATGSIDEDAHLGAGLSHILEHMLFKGTKTRSTNEIAQKIQDVGGYINAYTSFDRTVFWIDVPKDGVATALGVLSDAMMNSTLPPEEYRKEQEVIRREFAMGMDDPDRVAGLLLFGTAYQRHPYRFPVIGEIEIYNQLTQEQVMQYYKTRYVPNNLTFIVVGDVDAEKVRQQLTELFTPYPEKSLKPVFIPAEPPQLGRREVHREFPTELTHLSLAWHIPEVTNPDVPALDLLSTILGDGRSSRLYRRVREEAGLAFGIGAFSYTPGDPGLFGIDATVDPKKREAAEQLVMGIVDEVKQAGVTAEELTKAKKILLSHHLGALTTMRGQASDTGSNWLLTRNLNFSRDYLAAVQKVTLDDIKRVAANYLTDSNLTVVSLNPKGSLTAKAEGPKVAAAAEIEKFELSNGLRLLVREDRRLPLVAMGAVFRGGLLAETSQTNGITRLMAKVLLKGTKTRTAEQIANQIEAVGGSMSSDAGNNSFNVSVDVTKPDVKLGVELLSDVLLNATMPEKAIAREKEIQIAAIQQEEEQLTTVARNIMRQALFPKHPYALRTNGSVESVQRLTQKDLFEFRDRYMVAKNGVIFVFGDVKGAEVKQLFEKALGGMKPGMLALTDVHPASPLSGIETVESRKEKAQGVIMVGFRGASISSPDRHALELIDEASSDLGSRFFVRIRGQMGLAYYVGASQMQGLVPGLFAFYLGTDPQKIEPVKTALLDEIHKLANDGLTNEELARAKKKLIGQQEIANQSNEAFGYQCALEEIYGLGFDYYKRLEHDVDAVTLDDIKRVAAKYFRDQPYVLATVRPPEGSAAAKQK
ncbi:MAG: insulinase family protein [Verrucomicrobia bacterium]|nr:MAG: insulinase family protein [Verrucomicrobiota bacterium]